jgi:putative ABC transport system ATP-binding protein
VSVIGSNGAGKSTLLSAIAGVFPCDSGRIILNGEDLTGYPEHRRARRVARVYQDPKQGTAPSMNIEEHLSMALARGRMCNLHWGVTNHLREKFRTELESLGMGLERRLKVPVGSLSGGQRQALALLMATIQPPELLLLDEHVAKLDPQTSVRILELTDKVIYEHKITTLMVTHNMEHALRHGSRLVMMHHGQILLNISGEEKKRLTVSDLIARFEQQASEPFLDERILP